MNKTHNKSPELLEAATRKIQRWWLSKHKICSRCGHNDALLDSLCVDCIDYLRENPPASTNPFLEQVNCNICSNACFHGPRVCGPCPNKECHDYYKWSYDSDMDFTLEDDL